MARSGTSLAYTQVRCSSAIQGIFGCAKGTDLAMGINMKAIQQMQMRLEKVQKELGETIVEGSAGGGVVVARVTGQKDFQSIKIDPSAVDPDDVEMLEDMINAAITDAMNKAGAMMEEKMGALTGGLKIPGL
jgi:DNA-binding YbaB/EbfC family protein